MLFHVSIDADNPRRVADVLAEIWGGRSAPFPPVIEGSWMAFAEDDRGTMIEVYPRGTELLQGDGDTDAYGVIGSNNDRSSTHFAMASDLSVESVLAIAKREGWPVKYRKRGDAFGVLELWIEGTRMIEVLTPEMQDEYRAAMTYANWMAMLKSFAVPA